MLISADDTTNVAALRGMIDGVNHEATACPVKTADNTLGSRGFMAET
ncbi:hypothetical protein [Shimia sagamensis]|uniref:Uncharacterized protein n=1 Tax=Shimia sagamensis TaxID=1566352 RepID=A0ABY1NQR3_9RHOB|nr:hypothetical protein [Shimia sagamensis]SMP13817.1 hypothetical protein SAMN06265373_102592 [Shimia sagamensis]